DADDTTADASDTMAVAYQPLVAVDALDDVSAGAPWTGSITTTGGTGTLAGYVLVSGSLPDGMTLTPNGSDLDASGTSVEGSYSFQIRAKDTADNLSNVLDVTVVASVAHGEGGTITEAD